MKPGLLDYLRCSECNEGFALESTEDEGTEIITGTLACKQCNREFPILRGVPRFTSSAEVTAEKAATAESFGWQWQHFTQADDLYVEQFLGWLAPVRPEFFKDRLVLEGGCGKGRHTLLAAQWGARAVIGVDLSSAVETAFAATRHLPNAHIIQADLYQLPLARMFDYAFSVGVLHHLPDPRAGFRALAAKVKPGGFVSAWVYGAENNGWITKIVNPIRKGFSSRISPELLSQLSKIPAALVYLGTKVVYGPLNRSTIGRKLAQHLFYNDYLNAISRFGWREQHTIVFDHLVAPTSHYIHRDEFEGWWADVGARDVELGWHNKNSWRGFGRLP